MWLPRHSLDWHILLSVHYWSAVGQPPPLCPACTLWPVLPQHQHNHLSLHPHSLPVTSVTMVIDHTSTSSLLPCQHVTLSAYRDATSRANQSSKARSEAQLKHVALGDEDIFQLFWRRFSHVCLKVPAADNFYLSWYMRGAGHCNLAQRQDFYPPYLREESFQRLKVSVCSLTASVVSLSALFSSMLRL